MADRPGPLAHLFRSELQGIADHVLSEPVLETGGDLFGYWTRSGAPVVLVATGPGPGARHRRAAFFQDERFLEAAARGLHEAFALQHVGEWHSHHRLGLAEPSAGDEATVRRGMAALGWRRFLLAIACIEGPAGAPSVRLGFFQFAGSRPVEECRVRVLGHSPVRAAGLPAIPGGRDLAVPPGSAPWTLRRDDAAVALRPVTAGWYASPAMRGRIATEVQELGRLRDRGARASMVPVGDQLHAEVELAGGPVLRFVLAEGFPFRPPELSVDGRPAVIPWDPSWTIGSVANELLRGSVAAGGEG